jgi:hypothetical protein
MLKDKYTENQEVAVEPMQQSVQFLQDPILMCWMTGVVKVFLHHPAMG